MPEKNVDPTERLLSLLSTLLQSRHGLTKSQLREAVDGYAGLTAQNFEATFERDKKQLTELGVPLRLSEAAFEADGHRYRVDPTEYRLPEIDFDAEEILALNLAARLWNTADLSATALRAVNRIAGASNFTPSAEAPASPFSVQFSAEEALVPELTTAGREGKVVQFEYRDARGAETIRTVSVWGLGSRFGHWYVAGHDHGRGSYRIFRLSRIMSDIAVVDSVTAMARPEGFTPVQALEALDSGKLAHAEISLAPGRGTNLRRRAARFDACPSHGATPNHWDRLSVPYDDVEAFSSELAALGAAVRVHAPQEVQDATVQRLARTLAAQRQAAPELELQERGRTYAGRASASAVAARCLDLVAFVRRVGAPTVAEASEYLGVTRRTLRGDIQRLSLCGPGSTEYGLRVDIWVDEDDTIVLASDEGLAETMQLTFDEAFTLGTGLQHLCTVPDASAAAAERALQKLRTATQHMDGLFDLVAPRSRAADDPAISGVLAEAITAHGVVMLTYVTPSREEVSERAVEPLRIDESGGRAYLRAWCRRSEGLRSFRLDRILAASRTDEVFDQSERHMLPRELYAPGDGDMKAVLGFSPRIEAMVPEFAPTRTGRVTGDARYFAEVSIADTAGLKRLLAEQGGELSVVSPPSLVVEVEAWLHEALETMKESAH